MKESELRDLLIKNLGVLEPGLTPIAKEKYIPNSIGTNSFIDIVAKDVSNHLVLIELKRSNQSAREALHEIVKYVEGAKQYLGVRDHEIRVFLVSTEWKELIVPFSRFVTESDLALQGLHLHIGGEGALIADKVELLKIERGRFIAPWHEINIYESRSSMERALLVIQKTMANKGIMDFVVVILEAAPGFNDYAKERLREALLSYSEDVDRVSHQVENLQRCEFILYVGIQMLSRDLCLKLLQADAQKFEEVKEVVGEMDGDEAIGTLHEYVLDSPPRLHCDYFEIGYPAKLKSKLLEDEGWLIKSIERFGFFARNPILTDDDILSELCGTTGATGQILKRNCTVDNKAHILGLRNDLSNCLRDNLIWKGQLSRILDEIVLDFPTSIIEVNVFNPSAGVMTLYLVATDEQGIRYCPNYWINVKERNEVVKTYVGALWPDGNPKGFDEIISKYYDGQIFGLLFTMTWGGYESRDTDVLEDLGLQYKSFRIDYSGTSRSYFVLNEDRWREVETINPFSSLFEFMNINCKLIDEIVFKIGSRAMPGGFVDMTL